MMPVRQNSTYYGDMITNRISNIYKNTRKFGLPYIFLKSFGAIGFNTGHRLRKLTEKYYASLSHTGCEKELVEDFTKQLGYIPDLENPQTFDEKLQWLKLYDSTPLKTRLADKYLVRDWVKDKIGEKYLIPLLGVWDSFDEIDFDKLPEEYVLQCNHGCGMLAIVRKYPAPP